jgi:Na+-transporting NADH:ubiquinone oxidoreductase subunit NqrB
MVKESIKDWKKEIARDLIALGSIPFFILVMVRIALLNNPLYFYKFLIAGIFFVLIFILFRANIYSGLGLISLIFTAVHYADIKYWIFASLVYVLLVYSLYYLKYEWKNIFWGIIFGAIGIFISYFVL